MTLRQLYGKIKSELGAAEASLILEHVCGLDRGGFILYSDRDCPPEQEQTALSFCTQRINGRPLQYILGEWTFRGGTFKVGEGVLIPRDDTEVLVNACEQFLPSDAKILDLCSGSGIIAVTLKRDFPQSNVTALEKSDIAFEYLKTNIDLNNVSVTPVKADVFTDHTRFENGSFDLIVSNPPYICTEEIKMLQTEVQKEPAEALDGGADGLDFYRCITKYWTPKLKPGGMLAFEIGEGQVEAVKALMTSAGIENIQTFLDIAGTHRVIIGNVS